MCECPRENLCQLCRQGLWDNLKGTAATRGEAWADHVARAVGRDRPWPAFEGRCADIAKRKVADLARDPMLLEMLAAELWIWAGYRWRRV